MEKEVLETLKEYYPELEGNPKLLAEVEQEGEKGVTFAIKMAGVREKAAAFSNNMPEAEGIGEDDMFGIRKCKDFLSSCTDVMALYKTDVKPKSDAFSEAVNSGDMAKLEPMMEDATYMSAYTMVGNEFMPTDRKGALQIASTGNLNDMAGYFQSGELKEKTDGLSKELAAMAAFHYAHDIDPEFEKRDKAEQEKIFSVIHEQPKSILALSFAAQKSGGAKIFDAADLEAKCALPAVKAAAREISYFDRDASLGRAAERVLSLDMLGKRMSLGRDDGSDKLSPGVLKREARA